MLSVCTLSSVTCLNGQKQIDTLRDVTRTRVVKIHIFCLKYQFNSVSSSVCLSLQDGKISSITTVQWSFLHLASLCLGLCGLHTLNAIPAKDLMYLLLQLCHEALPYPSTTYTVELGGGGALCFLWSDKQTFTKTITHIITGIDHILH